jgi:TRAP-type C4-dicarboxylate transport system substrate-binding protein
MKDETDRAFEAAGFVNLGFGDVGLARFMSRGAGIRAPEDLRGKSPYLWDADVIAPVLYRVIGGVTPNSLAIPAVLPALIAGSVDVVNTPALAAVHLQWAPRLTHLTMSASSAHIGALVMRKSTLDSLPEDQRRLLLDTGRAAAVALTRRIRAADAHAYDKLRGKLENVGVSEEDEAKWKEVFKKTREQLKQGVFDPALVTRLEAMAG